MCLSRVESKTLLILSRLFTPQKEMTLAWPCSIVGNFLFPNLPERHRRARMQQHCCRHQRWHLELLASTILFLFFYFGAFIVALWSSLQLTHTSHNAPLLSRDSKIKELTTQDGDRGVSCCLLLTGKTFMGHSGSHIYWKWDHQREWERKRESEVKVEKEDDKTLSLFRIQGRKTARSGKK